MQPAIPRFDRESSPDDPISRFLWARTSLRRRSVVPGAPGEATNHVPSSRPELTGLLTCGESIPRIAFGKFIKEGERIFLPISVEVHHALMDGLHVGRFMMRLEEMLANPQQYIG